MKKIIFIISILTISWGFISCNNDDDKNNTLEMYVEEVHFLARGGETSVEIVEVTGKLNIESDDWIDAWVDEEEGKIRIKLLPYFGKEDRKGNILVRSGKNERTLLIVQKTGTLEVIKGQEVKSSITIGGEHLIKLKSTFPEDVSKLTVRLKDEKDKDWITGTYISNTELKVTVGSNPTQKPKTNTMYLLFNHDDGSTIMDSIMISSSYYSEQDILNTKWIASFENKKKEPSQEEVVLSKDKSGNYILSGISLYKNSVVPSNLNVQWDETLQTLTIPVTSQYVHKDSDGRYIFMSVLTQDGLMYAVGSGPQSYVGYLDTDSQNNVYINFPKFNYSLYTMAGIAFRLYSDENAQNSSNLGITRYIFNLKLEKH